MILGKVGGQADDAKCRHREDRVKRHEVGREGNQDVVFIGDNVPAFGAHPELTDFSPAQQHKKGVGELVTEDIEIERAG